MISMTALLLGTKKLEKPMRRPPASAIRKCNLANFAAPIGSIDRDDDRFASFTELIDGMHPTSQENLRRIAWAIRRTGSIGHLEMMHKLNVESSYMNKLWRILEEQGWVEMKRSGSRHKKTYVQTDLGKQMFADTGSLDERKAA